LSSKRREILEGLDWPERAGRPRCLKIRKEEDRGDQLPIKSPCSHLQPCPSLQDSPRGGPSPMGGGPVRDLSHGALLFTFLVVTAPLPRFLET
jgi:hypothetical protein